MTRDQENTRERVDLARSFVGGIFPVGQAVVARIPKSGNSISHNPPAISIRYYQSPMSSQDGPLAGIERPRLLCALPASPFTRTRDILRAFVNLCRRLTGWSFGSLIQPRKQPSGRFTQGFHSSVAPAFHEQEQTTGEVGNVREPFGEVRNVEC